MVEIRNIFKKPGRNMLALLLLIAVGGTPVPAAARTGSAMPYRAVLTQTDTLSSAPQGNREAATHARLMRRMQRNVQQSDSLRGCIDDLRRSLSLAPERSAELAEQILPIESRLIALLKERNTLADSITRIEQHWIAIGYTLPREQAAGHTEQTAPTNGAPSSRNLVANAPFRDRLPARDYRALLTAQNREKAAFDLAARYIENHATISELMSVYDTVRLENEALKIQERCTALQEMNRTLGDSLHTVWSSIFDSKSFAYGYLLDLTDHSDLRRIQQEELDKAARQIARLKDSAASAELVEYFIHKKMMLRMEREVASLFNLPAARDSLQAAENLLDRIDFRLSRKTFRERYFIDFEDAKIVRPSVYNYKNPIPECKIYTRGTIYRIRLGVFSSKRPVSVFRGVCPLGYLLNENRRWEYYAGGYATHEEAVKAREELKKAGFRSPVIVVWNDGEKSEPGDTADPNKTGFRLEIAGRTQLTDAVRELIDPFLREMQFSRISDRLYVLGMFFDKAQAEQLAARLMQADGELEIKVVENGNNPQ